MDDLAKKSKVNKASIYYHFNDKRTLYEHCFTHQLQQVVDTVLASLDPESSPEQQLKTYITTFSRVLTKNTDFSALMLREVASGGANMPAKAIEILMKLISRLGAILSSGQQQGLFIEIDPMSIHFLVIGGLQLYTASAPMREKFPVGNIPVDRFLKTTDIGEHYSHLILRALHRKGVPNA